MKTKLEKYSHIVIGIFLVSFAFNLFLSPYDFVTGGVSGLSIIIRHFIPLNESLFMILCNALLLIISYFLLGKEKTKNHWRFDLNSFTVSIEPSLISLKAS